MDDIHKRSTSYPPSNSIPAGDGELYAEIFRRRERRQVVFQMQRSRLSASNSLPTLPSLRMQPWKTRSSAMEPAGRST